MSEASPMLLAQQQLPGGTDERRPLLVHQGWQKLNRPECVSYHCASGHPEGTPAWAPLGAVVS